MPVAKQCHDTCLSCLVHSYIFALLTVRLDEADKSEELDKLLLLPMKTFVDLVRYKPIEFCLNGAIPVVHWLWSDVISRHCTFLASFQLFQSHSTLVTAASEINDDAQVMEKYLVHAMMVVKLLVRNPEFRNDGSFCFHLLVKVGSSHHSRWRQ